MTTVATITSPQITSEHALSSYRNVDIMVAEWSEQHGVAKTPFDAKLNQCYSLIDVDPAGSMALALEIAETIAADRQREILMGEASKACALAVEKTRELNRLLDSPLEEVQSELARCQALIDTDPQAAIDAAKKLAASLVRRISVTTLQCNVEAKQVALRLQEKRTQLSGEEWVLVRRILAEGNGATSLKHLKRIEVRLQTVQPAATKVHKRVVLNADLVEK